MNSFSLTLRSTLSIAIMTLVLVGSLRAEAWKELYEKNGVTVWQKKMPDSAFVAFRGQMIVSASIKKVLAVLNDQDRKTEWMTQCVANYVLERKAELGNLIIYNRTGSHFPLVADRDVVVETKFAFDVKGGKIDIVATNVERSDKGPIDGVVRMKHLHLRWLLEYVSNTKTRVTYEVQTDPGGWLPAWVVNLVARGIPYGTLLGLNEQSQKPYERSMAYMDANFDWKTIGL